ncbi:WD repeat-containing protein 81 [Biomphalaria glabrata]|uniref:WD repeat-containing protein 81-like n=1 Tax=Biomphalaria glabrata TaxID=6526 RepID=A0A9W3A0U4_BIOGL|nr:WD repeat-containing protein 81-like [Biomphalaria glabrata]KAI8746893.1 WD repeat-containing protein 81-like [Biomphalaria glabrata]
MYDPHKPPNIIKNINEELLIPNKLCQPISSDRSVCIVNEEWLRNIQRGQIIAVSGADSIETCLAERYLSRSCDKIPTPWVRITVKTILKSDELYESLPGQCLQKQWACGSLYEFMSHITKENMTNLWIQAQSTLTNGAQFYSSKKESLTFTELVRKLLRRLNPLVYINLQPSLDTDISRSTTSSICSADSICTGSSSRPGSFYTVTDAPLCHGIVPVHAVIETEHCFFVIQPYYQFVLRNAISYSPSILDTCHAKPLFIFYQLLHVMQSLHNHGLRMGDIRLSDIVMDKNMWLRVTCPRISNLKAVNTNLSSPDSLSGSLYLTANSPDASHKLHFLSLFNENYTSSYQQSPNGTTNQEKMFQAACDFMKAQQYKNFEITMLDSIVEAWVHRQINNFQYLMILNHLAGRQMGDPNNHPVLPWVLDFSSPDSGYRDLKKSKFRLNKGDNQLDFTYSGMGEFSETMAHVPHHVSDILSDITYYVYKARRTSKSILCAHVRSKWVPHEYPLSMQRLQDWTPDECIPEFFTDPTIFDSIHEDLPDLEIPPWSKNALDFVIRHLAALECDYVSTNLHHWIDLTFGYKLSGTAAVKAKNVHLHLVDQHTYLIPYGAMQLFAQPHPQREPQKTATASMVPQITRVLLNSQLLTYGLPEVQKDSQGSELSEMSEAGRINQATIHLPRNYNPTTELEQCETLQEFKAKALHSTRTHFPAPKPPLPPKYQDDGVTEDMVTLLCLVCEIFLDSRLRMQDTQVPLWKRLKTIKKILSPDYSEIQRPLQKFVMDMFESLEVTPDKKFVLQAIFPDGSPPPTPSLLIQSYSDLIPYPSYFSELYSCLSQIEGKQLEIEQLKMSWMPLGEKTNRIKQLEREKVPILDMFLWRHQSYLGSEGMGLVLPYIQDLLQNEFTTVHAAWSLFNVVTRELGPEESTKQFLPSLTALYSGEISSAKHIKLYHRSFLTHLIIRLGLKTFLTYFSTLLVEAVAGYKDFPIANRFYSEELMEALNQDAIFTTKRDIAKSTPWTEGVQDYIDSVDEDNVEDYEGRDEDNLDSLTDPTAFDGSHVLLETEGVTVKDSLEQADDLERVSIDSVEGEDVISEAVSQLRRTKASGYSSEDQYSIHSLSNILQKRNPLQSIDLDPFEDTDIVFEENDQNDAPSSAAQGIEKKIKSSQKEDTLEPKSSRSVLSDQPSSQTRHAHFSKSLPVQSEGNFVLNENLDKNTCTKEAAVKVDADSAGDNKEKLARDNQHLDTKKEDSPSENVDRVDGRKSTSDMVRSETEDLMHHLTSDNSGCIFNIRDVACDSVKWLCHKLGPVLATKYLSRNLVRMLALCYLGQEQLQFVDEKEVSKTSRLVVGDVNAQRVLECIGFSVVLYGEQVILIQCLPNIMDMIALAQKRLSPRTEAGLIASVILLSFLIPYMSDTSLMSVLEDHILSSCISPIVSLITSPTTCCPNGPLARLVLCHKFIDLLYILGLRLGFEMTRKYLTKTMVTLFNTFSYVYGQSFSPIENQSLESTQEATSSGSDESYLNIKMDILTNQYKIGSPVDPRTLKSLPKKTLSKMHSLSSVGIIDDKDDYMDAARSPSTTTEKCTLELKTVFSAELAQACYIPFCRIFGSIHMEENLNNEDLIRQLCAQHDSQTDSFVQQAEDNKVSEAAQVDEDLMTPTDDSVVTGGLGSNVALVGNRISLTDSSLSTPVRSEIGQFGRGYKHNGILSIHYEDIRSAEMESNKSRHLKGNWLAYWERELGLHERDTMFNFLQIELQTYIGHSSSIRSIHAMDTENCFISASKDKTVKLWSINSCGDGMKKQTSQFCYMRHKKSVFSVCYVESMRLVASCDSTVHIWDPYTGVSVNQLESSSYPPIVALASLPAPSPLVVTATTEATLRFLDLRTSKYIHEFHCSVGNTGLIRCLVVSPDSSWIAVGFSSGLISILDINSGILLHYWKAHDGEILQLKAYSKSRLLSSSFDQTIKLWNVDTGQEVCASKNQSEPVHCLCLYRDQLICATTANKISVYANITDTNPASSSKLRSSAFKGVLTHMAVLPLNKALLLSSDNGIIRLMA